MLLEPFQAKFMAAATAPKTHLAALSLPRGNGKSRLAAHLVERILTPSDQLFRPGSESVLCAASIEQARIVFRFARAELEPSGEYRFIDSATRAAILHKATNTRLRVIGSNGKTAMGVVGCPWAIADEPGSWETTGGQLLFDAIETAKGKPGSPLRSLYIGTLSPATSGWWHELALGKSGQGRVVKCLQGDRAKWSSWREVARVNPLTKIAPEFRKQLRSELKAAIADSRLKARFLSYRLNLPSADEATMLLTVDDFEQMAGREVADQRGRPIVAIDLGGGRAWSAATAIWQSGRVEALAVAPGIPDIQVQEDRDQVPRGTYGRLLETGRLRMAHGLRVQPPSALMAAVKEWWGEPELIVCDRFRLGELKDCVNGTQVIPRVARWSEAGDDIRSLRRLVKDGPLSVEETSRPLLSASLSVAMVKNDDAGNTRLTKKASNNTARDDVAAALEVVRKVFSLYLELGGALLRRVTVSGDTIRIELSNRALLDGTTGPGMIDTIEPGEPATIEVPFQLRRRGVEIRLVLRAEGAEAPDDKLVALAARSHRWLDQLTSGAIASIREIAQAEGIDGGDVSRFLPLAFLAPGIVEALMNGRQGVELTAEKMRQILPIPCSWREQRHQLNL